MLNDATKEKLSKLTRSMVHGEIRQHPDILEILKQEGLIFEGEENQPASRFIVEARFLLDKYGR